MIKKMIVLLLALAMAVGSAACGGTTELPPVSDEPAGSVPARGVTDTTIYIGVHGTAGNESFRAGLEGALLAYNTAGGFRGLQVIPVYADDAAPGEDEVFALVGYLGSGVGVEEYIGDAEIPAVTVDGRDQDDGLRRFPVRPTYAGEGRALLARAQASGAGLGGSRVGVVSTADEMGTGLLSGILRQAEECGTEVFCWEAASSGDFTAALSALQAQGCDVVILAMGQDPLAAALGTMDAIGFDAKVLTAHSNAPCLEESALAGYTSARRPVYATGWLNTSTEAGLKEYYMFMRDMMAWESVNGIDSTDYTQTYVLDPEAVVGYAAAAAFLHGLKQVEERGDHLSWESYTAAMEAAPLHIPMGGNVDFSGGSRLGNTALALYRLDPEPDPVTGGYDLEIFSQILALTQVPEADK